VAAGSLLLASGAGAARLDAPAQLKLVNYYPARDGWAYMWQRWHPATIDRDFARIQWLNANTVRVIVQAEAFGFPNPSPVYLDRLASVIGLAAAHGLDVELTLFDWWFEYDRLPASKRWARAMVGPYAGDDRVAAIELKNEIDPGDAHAMRWASAMVPFLQRIDGGIPVTLSVTGTNLAARIDAAKAALGGVEPDFWSVHYYDKPELAPEILGAAKEAAAPTPLYVGETGYFDGDSDPAVRKSADRDDEQVRYLRSLNAATSLLGLPQPAPWILSDFTPAAARTRLPAVEYRFGLFRTNGRPKPAAAEVRAIFGGPSPDLSFDAGFEQVEPGLPTPEPAFWRRRGAAGFALDSTVAHSGASSVSLSGIGGYPTRRALLWTQPPAPWVAPGDHVTLTAWARGAAVTGANRISLVFYDGVRRLLARTSSQPLAAGTTDWTQLTAEADAPPGATYVRIEITSNADVGTAWFDDVALATAAPAPSGG
jgi:hypothetical protein